MSTITIVEPYEAKTEGGGSILVSNWEPSLNDDGNGWDPAVRVTWSCDRNAYLTPAEAGALAIVLLAAAHKAHCQVAQ